MSETRNLFDDLEPTRVWTDRDWNLAGTAARRLFNPSSPIDEDRFFSGRSAQVVDLLDIVFERGAHAVIFGERGVGKSSIANTIVSRVPPEVPNIKFLKENCRPEDSFFEIWSKLLWNFDYTGIPISDYLRDETRSYIVVKILESLSKDKQYVFILDEFDRITSAETKAAMADTIKHFSDYPQNITIIVVGVGLSIEELFGAHPSIQRCCRQIPMQRMSEPEMVEILDSRYPEIGLSLDSGVQAQLIDLARGMPGFVHLIGREAALSAIDRRSRDIEDHDVSVAIRESVRRAQESIITAYKKATYSAKENIYREVLLACALSKCDEQGKFSASEIRDQLKKILRRPIEISGFTRHLSAFCDEERGAVLRKSGKPKRFQYQFIDAPLQPYVVMAGKRDGMV